MICSKCNILMVPVPCSTSADYVLGWFVCRNCESLDYERGELYNVVQLIEEVEEDGGILP